MLSKIVNGIPTEPDVKSLLEAFSTRGPGDVIKHEEIEVIIHAKWKTPRYRVVTDAWRRRLRRPEFNLATKAVVGVGYSIRLAEERVSDAIDKMGQGVKRIRRAHRDVCDVPVEQLRDPVQLRRKDFVQELAGRLVDNSQRVVRQIALTNDQPRLPRSR